MKTFRYPKGHTAGMTMTVRELKMKLEEYPEYMPVFGTWEGVRGYVEPDNFSVETVSKGHGDDRCDCLLIDVGLY